MPTVYTYDSEGNLVDTEEFPYVESRSAKEYFSPGGVKYETMSIYVATSGHETFRVVGDPESKLYVGCPAAPERFFKCVSYEIPPVNPSATTEELNAASAAIIMGVAELVDSIRPEKVDGEYVGPDRCPIHNSTPEPTALDVVLASFDPATIQNLLG